MDVDIIFCQRCTFVLLKGKSWKPKFGGLKGVCMWDRAKSPHWAWSFIFPWRFGDSRKAFPVHMCMSSTNLTPPNARSLPCRLLASVSLCGQNTQKKFIFSGFVFYWSRRREATFYLIYNVFITHGSSMNDYILKPILSSTSLPRRYFTEHCAA